MGAFYGLTFKAHSDISQMFDRGMQFAVHNKIIFFGNASSGGMGKVPGGLSSVIVGWPLKVWQSPYSVLLSLSFIHLLSLFWVGRALQKFFSPKAMWIFLLLYWLSPWRVSEIYVWNPSYLFLASALHLYSASIMAEKKSFIASFAHVFSLWFAFQIHNSSIILLFLSLFLFFNKKIKIHWAGALLSGAIGVGTLVPYVVAVLQSPEHSPVIKDDRYFLFRGLLYVFPILKAIWYWVRFSTTVFPKHIFQHLEFSWVGNATVELLFSSFTAVLKYGLAVVTALVSFRLNYKYWKSNKSRWIDSYVVFGFWALLIAAALSPIDFIFWHLIILFPVSLVPILTYVENEMTSRQVQKVFVVGFFYFTFYNAISGLGSEKHSISENPQVEFDKVYKYKTNNKMNK